MSNFSAPLRRIFKVIATASYLGSGTMLAPVAHADQNDPALPDLFAGLAQTTRAAEANAIQLEIWARWTDFASDDAVSDAMREGVALMDQGRLVQAEAVFDALVVTAPDFAEAWNKRATIRFLRGNHAGSKRDIIKVIELEPRHFGALAGLGMIHLNAGNLQGALQAYEAALAVNPHMKQARHIIARLSERLDGQAL